MKLKDFIAEHKRLISILKSGTPQQRKQEAKTQTAELLKRLKSKK